MMRPVPAPPTSLRAAAMEAGSDCNCFSLRQAARAVSQFYDDALRPSGLRITQFTLLSLVMGHGSVGINELADASVTDRTTLTRNLAVLQRDGLVRTTESDDRRFRVVELTKAGQEAVAVAIPLWRRAQSTLSSRLGKSSLESLRSTLTGVVDATSS